MKRLLFKVVLLGCIVSGFSFLVFSLQDKLALKLFGPNTRTQIEESFHNAISSGASNWIMGNSRVYRGLNPDIMGDSWYNLAHDNDSYNQIYYKIQYLFENGCRMDTLILGIDYFQFSVFSNTRNYIYDNLLGREYVRDYNDFLLIEHIDNFKRMLITKQGLFFKTLMNIGKINTREGQKKAFLRNNGQYINDLGVAKENDFVDRDSSMNEIQKHYFREIVLLCKKHDVIVFALMMPVRDNELKCYDSFFKNSFQLYIQEVLNESGYMNHVIDMSELQEFKDYHKYTDITHLNSESADDFTRYFYKELNKRYVSECN